MIERVMSKWVERPGAKSTPNPTEQQKEDVGCNFSANTQISDEICRSGCLREDEKNLRAVFRVTTANGSVPIVSV